MFGKKSNDNGEKLYRYSIRKYHFGAASVAIAALMFFANGVAKADMTVSPATANTEKVGVAVTGLTEGVPPTEGHSEKSQEVGSEKEAIAKKSVDKSALNQALSELQAAIAKADEESLLSLSNQLSQLTDENKRLLDGENVSEEAIASQVSRVQSFTEQVRLLKSKAKDKDSNKEDRTDSKVQDKKELKVSDKAVIPTDQNEEIKAVQKDDNKEDTANKDKLESLSKSLITYLYTAKKIERPETKKFLEGVEEVVRSVENGLKNPQLTASEIEELMKKGKQAEKKLALAVTREHSGKRDLDNGKKMLPESYFRSAIYRAANGIVYDAQGNDNLRDAEVGYITKAGDNSGYPEGTFLYISHNDNSSANGRNNANLGPQPVKRLKQKVLAEVTKQSNGYHWKITYNNARESRQNPIYYFTVPSGHSVQNMTLKENGSVVKHGGVAQVFNGEADKYLTAVGSPNGGVNGSPYYENVANTQNGIVGNRGGIYTLDDFVRNDTSVYFNRDGMSEDDKRITDKLYDKIKSSTQNVFAFRPRDFDAANTYEVEFDTKADTEAPLYYIAGMKSYEKIPSGRFMHKSYQQWYGVQERYNVTVDTNMLKTTFLKGTGIGTLDTESGLMSNAVTIEDTYKNNSQTNPGRGDVTDYHTYKSTGNFSADYLKSLHNRFSRQRSEDGVNTTADRTKGNHTLYIEAKVKGQPIKFRLPYRIVTQSDIYQPVAKEVTDTKNYKADLGNADTYIKSYTDVSSQIDGFKTPDADDMGTPNPGNSFYKDRISEFPRTSDKIKEQAVKQVQWVGDSSLSTGKRVIELTLDNHKTELFTVPDDIDVLPGGKISKENLEKLKEAIRQQYQKVNTNGHVEGNVPTIMETTPVWVKKQVKVTYYDNENNSSTNNQDDSVDYVDVLFKHIQKEAKPAAPTIATPLDGSASVTPNGTTDKMVVSYRPTRQQSDTTLTVKKEGSSWGVVGNRPDGVTVDTSTGRVSITEQTVEDNTKIKAIATYLNSDETSAEDTVKSRDTQAPTVMMNGKVLTERASDNRFVIFRGANFNPTFKVTDNSNTIAEFNVKNIPNGVWFNKSGNKDYARTLITNGDYHFSNTKVDDDAPLVTREASVTVRDLSGNAKEYKFEYTIADVMVRNSPKAASLNDKIGDSHNYLIDTLNGSTDQGNKYFPGGMRWEWENANQNTTLTNLGLVRHVAKAVFPTGAQNGSLTANGMTLYAPSEIKKEVNFNVTDNAKPQATLNGVSLGTTAGEPIFTIFRGATFNPELKAWDNAGKISNVTVSGLPEGVTSTNFPGSQQTGSETQKYTAKLSNGTVNNDYALGEHEATLTVTGSDSKDVSTFKFKYRVVDLDFKNVYETPDAGQPGGKSYVIGLHDGNSVNVTNGTKNINPKDYWKVINDSSKADRGYSYLPDGMVYSINNGGISSNPADASKGASIAMGHYGRMIKADFSGAGDIANNESTSRTVFAPATIERRILVAVDPTAPTIDGNADLLYGQAGHKPDIKVKNIVNIGESTSEVGTVNKEATRTVQLYSDQDDTTPIAEHSFDKGSRETEWTFRESDISRARPNGLREGETLYARVKVTHRGVSTMSGNSNEKEVTARLNLIENATNRIVQANDSKLNDAEKAAIRIALKKANPTLDLKDENIEISDSGAIVVTKDKKRGWLQTEPNKNRGEGFVTRFADIRKDFLLENIEGAKLPNRDTDKGFAWSNSTSDQSVNGNRSLIYYYDATKGQGINLNDVLRMMHLKPRAGTNSVENPSLVEVRGDDKEKAEHNREGYSKDSRTNEFKKGSAYINTLDLVDAGNLSGGQVVSNSPNKLVENGKGTPGAVGTSLQNASIAGANGIQAISLNHVANGSSAIYKAQLYLRPEYVNTTTLSKRGENKDTTTNVINVYFVPVDVEKPQVQRSSTNNLGVAEKFYDYLPKEHRPDFTSLVKLTDNYDKDDDTDAKNNPLRHKLSMWLKTGNEKTLIVENGVEKQDVIEKLYNNATSTTVYELLAKTEDNSGNNSSEDSSNETSLGFFKTQYPAVTYRKKDNQEVSSYSEIVGQPLTSAVVGTGGRLRPVKPDFYVAFDGRRPNATSITFKDGVLPDRSTTAGVTKKTIIVEFPNGSRVEKEITINTYGNEVNYPEGKTYFETEVGKNFEKQNAADYVKTSSSLANPLRTAIAWGDGYSSSANPVSKVQTTIGMREENVNVYYTSPIARLRGDDTFNYTHQDIKVDLAVKPQAPMLSANQFQGKAGTKPEITVSNLPTTAQLTAGLTVTVQLKDAAGTVVAEKTVAAGTESTTFAEADYRNPVTLGQQLTANVVVSGTYQKTKTTDTGTRQVPTAYSLVSNNSNSEQVTPQKPTFDTATVTSTSRTLRGTLGGFNATNKVVKVHLNDENNTILSSENNGEVTINDNTWTATLPATVKLRQSVAKNGETTTPRAITVENTVTGGTVSTTSDEKEVTMGAYSVSPAIAGSKHIDIAVPHDAKRVELRFHNNQEKGDKPNSVTLVRGADGTWHTDATRADNATVTDASGYVGRISSSASKTNPAESIITIPLNEESNGKKLHIREEAANGDNTETYGKGLGLRVDYQLEAGQDPTAAGNWKVVNVTNTAPTIKVKGDTGKDETHRKVYDSGTRLTADLLKDLVTVTDAEDGRATESEKPYGTGNVKVVSELPTATGATPAGVYEVTLVAVDSQGKEGSQVKVYVAVKEAKPTAPSVGQWQNGNVRVTPDSTNSGDKITIPLNSGSVVVTKDAQNVWQVTGQANGVSVHDGSIEIPRNLVNTTVTATASKGEGDIKAVSDEGTHTLTAHEVTKADIIKKPTNHLTGTDLYSATGVTGVIENGVTKTYQKAGIKSVTSDGQLPELEADKEKQVPVVITYNDGSQEKTNVTLKVAPAAPNVTVNKQDGTTGDVTLTIKRHDDTNYPDGSVVTVPRIDETFRVKDGTITIKNDQLKDTVQTGKVIVKEGNKLPAETDGDKVIPAKKQASAKPVFTQPRRDDNGDVHYRVTTPEGTSYPQNTPIKLDGVGTFTVGANGELTIPNANLPESEANKVPTATEDGKLATAGESVSVPAKKMSAKGNPAVEFIVEFPLPIVVPDSDHLTPQEIEKLVDEVKKSNPNTIVTADDKGNVTVTDQATGESVLIPVKDLTVLDFEPVTPTDKVPVKDLNNLSKDEQDKVKESVEKANPGKDVIVASDGNVTITNPETNVTHNIPRDELLFAYAKGEPEVLKNPEFNGGVNAPDSPIHEVPEFNGGVNGEPESQEELPEFNGGVNAPDSPIHEVPEFNGGVNGEPEVQAENPGYNGPIGTTGVDENGNLIAPPVVDLPEFTGGVNGELPDPAELPKVQLIITKWIDEEGNELKPADAKAPSVPGETNEAFEHGEIEGYVFVRTETKGDVVTHIFRKVSPARPTGDDHQEPATPSADTNPRLNNVTPAEVSATQPQAVLPNTGTKADCATGALGVLSLLGTFGLLAAKKKKDDEEEA